MLAVVAIIVVGKSVAATALVLSFGYPLRTALTVSASLAQIGEFSFILAALGLSLEPAAASKASSLISRRRARSRSRSIRSLFTLDRAARRFVTAVARRSARLLESRFDPLAELPSDGGTVPVEAGRSRRLRRVGKRIADALEAAGIAFVVVEENREAVEQLRSRGMAAVFGNATDPTVLVQAHIATARMLVVATPETIEVR